MPREVQKEEMTVISGVNRVERACNQQAVFHDLSQCKSYAQLKARRAMSGVVG